MKKTKCLWCEELTTNGDFCDDLCRKLSNARNEKSWDILRNVEPKKPRPVFHIIRGRRG